MFMDLLHRALMRASGVYDPASRGIVEALLATNVRRWSCSMRDGYGEG